MVSFECDYNNGCHPAILDNFVKTNQEPQIGYGFDDYSVSAAEKIRLLCGGNNVQVELTSGGTQTNQLVISTMLKQYEGVISAKTGHISVHESGAIEATGHKVLEIEPVDGGKIKASDVDVFVDSFYKDPNYDHMVFPGMVYISHPTEYGMLYTKQELSDLHDVCVKYNIPLYMDGARLGYALMSYDTDVTISDIVRYTDVFYIGGTKVGALIGEAVVFTHNNRPEHFFTMKKRMGDLLAKGRLVGISFDTLFTDNLYFKISRNAIDCAMEMKKVFKEKNIPFFVDSPTNQQFVILSDKEIEKISRHVRISVWDKIDPEHHAVRFATSWSSTMDDIKLLRDILWRNL